LTIYSVYLVFAAIFWGLSIGFVGQLPLIWIDAGFSLAIALMGTLAVGPLRRRKLAGWRGVFVMWLLISLEAAANLAANWSRIEAIWTVAVIIFFLYGVYEVKEFYLPVKKSRGRVKSDRS
jgi:hypothetical protein